MMKLLLVEDEALFRETLAEIPWDSIGVTLIGTAANAAEAIAKIRREPPDIIVTDIEMEDGDGFALAKELVYLLPGVKIIFLTAYDKFEYAQQAIHYKASAFILKPLDRKKLLQAVTEAKTEIEAMRAEQEKYHNLAADFNNCKYFLKDYFFSNLTQDLQGVNNLFSLGGPDARFQVVIAALFDASGQSRTIPFNIFMDILHMLEQSDYRVIPFYERDLLTFVFCWDPPETDGTVFDHTFEAASEMTHYMKCHNDIPSYTVAIGSVAESPEMLPYCQLRAKEALKYRFSLGSNEIIYIDDIEPLEHSVVNLEELKDALIDSIKIGDSPSAEKTIYTLFKNIKESYVSLDLAQRICFELFITISIALAQLGHKSEALFDKTEIWSVLKNRRTLQDLRELTLQITEVAISLINTSRDARGTDIINHVKQLIENNTDMNISLQEMAKRVYISPCYLSSLFKKKTGVSYKNYAISIKINKAKDLLANSSMPIHEIASVIGYKSNQHFSHLFRQQTGLLPTEYRSQNRFQHGD